MHVCLLSDGYPPWERGGAQKVAAQLARRYARRGHRVSAIATVDDVDDAGRSRVDGVSVHRIHAPRRRALLPYLRIHNPRTVGPCRRLLAALAPDAVHAHNVHYLSTGALRAADDLGVPVLKTYHDAGTFAYGEYIAAVDRTPVPEVDDASALDADATPPVPEPPSAPASAAAYRVDPLRQLRDRGVRYFPLRNRLQRRALDRHVDAGVAVSRALGRALRANGLPCRGVIHNGVDADRLGSDGSDADADANAATALRRDHGLGDARVILFGGRTGYAKGGAHLAAAFARAVARTDRDAKLLVTGDDEYVPEMRRVVRRHSPGSASASRTRGDADVAADADEGTGAGEGAEVAATAASGVVAAGWLPRDRLRAAFRTAAVVATPSVHLDPFPTVNLEAFAAGTPVVTTRFGGASELVAHGENGLVVDPRDTRSLATALAALVDRPALAAAYGAAGRRTVCRRFTVERQVTAYLDLLGRIASA